MNNTPPTIRTATADDLELLTDIFTDSFASDPILNWVIPMPELYPGFFRLIIEEVYLPGGISYLESEGRGASLWLPPGREFVLPMRLSLIGMILRLIAKKGLRPGRNIREQGNLFAMHHPKQPHYYLQFIGTRQQQQGRGVGAALLKEGTRACDQAGMPAYLESSNVLNVPLYQRHGFEVIHEQDIPGGGPRVWFMWREARPKQSA